MVPLQMLKGLIAPQKCKCTIELQKGLEQKGLRAIGPFADNNFLEFHEVVTCKRAYSSISLFAVQLHISQYFRAISPFAVSARFSISPFAVEATIYSVDWFNLKYLGFMWGFRLWVKNEKNENIIFYTW